MGKILLTFDLEYWTESLSVQKYIGDRKPDSIKNIIDDIMSLLAYKNYTATFFVTKKVLETEPEAIKKLFSLGNEIAIHAENHVPLWQLNGVGFNKEIKLMAKAIKNVTGKEPKGFRAVNFSLDNNTKWALDILIANGISYDSSIFPCKLPRLLTLAFKGSIYGIKSKNFSPYKICLENPTQKNRASQLTEIPISVFHNKIFRLPLTGGIYIRTIPWPLFKHFLARKLKDEPACLHFHPFDFIAKKPAIKMPVFKKVIKFYNTKNTFKKLKYITDHYQCSSIEQYLNENTSY